jgi:hypothetical protein
MKKMCRKLTIFSVQMENRSVEGNTEIHIFYKLVLTKELQEYTVANQGIINPKAFRPLKIGPTKKLLIIIFLQK